MANNVSASLNMLDSTLQQIEEMRERIAISANEASYRITHACQELIQAVEERRETLLAKCNDIAEEKDYVLSIQYNELKRLRSDLARSADDAQNSQQFTTQEPELKEDDTIATSLDLQTLLEQVKGFGFFPGVPEPSKCSVEGLAVPYASVGKERKVAVILKNEKGEPVTGRVYPQYQLRKVNEDPLSSVLPKVTVSQSKDGVATLAFTPDQTGVYDMIITVRNKLFNPCVITAHPPRDYSTFGEMQAKYKEVMGHSHGIAAHNNGTIYVSKHNQDMIRVFKPDGSQEDIKLNPMDVDKFDHCKPQGIAIIRNVLYVVCSNDCTVKKFSTVDGEFIKSIGGYGQADGQFDSPECICTDGKGRLLVGDCSHRIQILTSSGKFVSSFKCSARPDDIAVDPMGKVHVVHNQNQNISVYSQDGNLLETYNPDCESSSPTGIYIDGEGNRLVTSYYNKKVYIADANNQIISTRHFDGAYMSTMDKNGAVLIADFNNDRIAIVN